MGRLIVYDSIVDETIKTFYREKNFHCGLIIGQCTDQKDIVIRFCPTPAKDDDVQVNKSDGDTQNVNQLFNLAGIDEEWIGQHAKQLMRALPGGLDILGFYLVAPSEYTTRCEQKLKEVLLAIFNILRRIRSFNLYSMERILVTICPTKALTICKTCDITDNRNSPNPVPATWKLLSGPMRWQGVRCTLAVDIKFPIKSEDAGLSLQKQIEIGLHPFLENIEEAHALVNGVQRDLDEQLNPLDTKRSKKNEQNENDETEWNNVDLFIPLENNNNIENPEECDCICMMTFQGGIEARAFIHSKSTVREAIRALKLDIVRSMAARCEIHCENMLLLEEEWEDRNVGHDIPKRVFAPLPQDTLCVCDYPSHSDTAIDTLEAFKELLSLDIAQNDLETVCEKAFESNSLNYPVEEESPHETENAPVHSSRSTFVYITGALLTAVVAALSYMMIPVED